MMQKRIYWVWLILTLAIGFGIGLTYSWIIAPVQYVEAEPHILRDDFKDNFRSAIAAAYASNTDLERARARLTLLGDQDASQALVAQAQRMLAAGEDPEAVQQVARLASALEGQMVDSPQPSKTATSTSRSAQTDESYSTHTPTIQANTVNATGTPESTTESEPTSTSVPVQTATPRPTRTATATLGAPYQLVGQESICEPELAEGLLQIVVTDIRRQQIPGAEIIVTWNNGEEHIFTGLKPELGYGYADFMMAPDVTYSVRMADGGTPASDLSAPLCTDTDGEPYLGGHLITFQQP
jgi:hypothetical protein